MTECWLQRLSLFGLDGPPIVKVCASIEGCSDLTVVTLMAQIVELTGEVALI